MLKVGDELGRYEIIAHLKSGGMASLYLGRRRIPPDNRIFAIKVVHPHFLDDEELVAMFEDEARLSIRIQHPNVVHIEEVGDVGGVHYLAMEYIHGCSVAQLLQALIRHRRRMTPELAVYIAMQVCEALDAAHSLLGDQGEPLNVVHRDVSPQNILLAHTGDLRLIDFGIAKSQARMHHSATGASVRGKLRYMSPEHAKGHNVDQRTDIYALGIVLWEMLTMRPLFWGETDFDVLTKVQDPLVDPPSEYAPNISPDLDDAVLIALSANREARPATALEFRSLLSRAAPIAEALDDEQIAELLHAVLGEEMHRVADRMPAFVSMDLKFPHADTATMQETPQLLEGALEALTGAQTYDPEVIKTFVGNPAGMYGIDELLGPASIELVEEETSTTISAVDLAEYIGKTSGYAEALHALRAEDATRDTEPQEPTDEISGVAAVDINGELTERAVHAAMLAQDDDVDFDTVTIDEGGSGSTFLEVELDVTPFDINPPEVDLLGDTGVAHVEMPTPNAEAEPEVRHADEASHDADDDDDDDDDGVTLVEGMGAALDDLLFSNHVETVGTNEAAWNSIDLGVLAAEPEPVSRSAFSTEAVALFPRPAREGHDSLGGGAVAPMPVAPGAVALEEHDTRPTLPQVRGAGPPPAQVGAGTASPTVGNGAPLSVPVQESNHDTGVGSKAGDRVALGAGILVAIVLLVVIAVFLLV